jgi:hypothetical protein
VKIWCDEEGTIVEENAWILPCLFSPNIRESGVSPVFVVINLEELIRQ